MQNQSSRVYSYLRFSDPKQADGGSVDRQIQYAQKWASEHRIPLDAALSMRDEGLSAYHQRHIKTGALGVFLAAIEAGQVAPGSVLIVEGLDRLSRAEPILAQAQLAQIVNAGVTVVTASDGREYNRENLKAQPMDLVYSLLVMIRAHEESDTKSKRVKAAIRRQCQNWINGNWRGVIRNGTDPAWVKQDGDKFIFDEDRAHALRRLIDLWLDGYGFSSAMEKLTAESLTDFLPKNATSLYKILSNKCLIGTRLFDVGGEQFKLEGYYPALISVEQFDEIQFAREKRHRTKGKKEIPSVLTGMGIAVCGYCGGGMASQNYATRKKKTDGTPQDGHRRLMCSTAKHNCPHSGGCSSVPIERALLTYCSDQINIDQLYQQATDQQAVYRSALVAARKRTAEIEKNLARITDALLSDNEAAPASFLKKARDLEQDLATAKANEAQAEIHLTDATKSQTPAKAEAWQTLFDAVMAIDPDARMQARKLIQETFERIVIYHRGITPADPYYAPIDLVLIARGGTQRTIRVHRRSGALITMDDLTGDPPATTTNTPPCAT